MYPFDLNNNIPQGYPLLANEPYFDPNKDLQLEKPTKVTLLEEVGYSKEDLKNISTNYAFSSVTRILSDEGVGKLYEVFFKSSFE